MAGWAQSCTKPCAFQISATPLEASGWIHKNKYLVQHTIWAEPMHIIMHVLGDWSQKVLGLQLVTQQE